jgi:RND family efflux transporter MFP subunit
MFRKKWLWIIVGVLVLAGGGYFAYTTWFAPDEAAESETVLQTATVTTGDLSITAAGTGVLVASAEVNLAFSAAGTVEELLVDVGDKVNAGDMLGWIDDADARQSVASAELQVIQAEQSLALAQAQAELAVAQAQANFDTAQEDLDALLDWAPDEDEIEMAQANLVSAQASYQNTLARAGVDQTVSVRINLDQAIASLADAQESYADAMSPDRDWEKNIEDTRARAADVLVRAQQNLEVAQASYDLNTISTTTADIQSAKSKVLSAQSSLDSVQTPPDEAEITAAQIKVQQMSLSLAQAKLDLTDVGDGKTAATREAEIALEQAKLKLATAQDTLAGTALVAPFAGTVTAVNFEVGETANGTVVVLANLETPVVQFWVEESDLNSVAEGHPVRIVFEALPDLTYTGEIFQVDPVLVSVSNTPAVQIWATIDTTAHPAKLLGDMNVEVEIVAGEALNALLVPVQALRQMGDQYAVFVVLPNGELEMRLVEVGLMDFVNAEIKSGLERGEVVSLGESTTSTTSTQSTTQQPVLPGGGFFIPGEGRP